MLLTLLKKRHTAGTKLTTAIHRECLPAAIVFVAATAVRQSSALFGAVIIFANASAAIFAGAADE